LTVSQRIITQSGDLWRLGDHRLLCGDSTQAESLQNVLQGQKAHITITDPPYNVQYGKHKRSAKRIVNDNLGDKFYDFLLAACQNIVAHTTGAIYIFMAASEMCALQKAFKEAGGHWSTFRARSKINYTILG
jgi:DNA modification methylase